MTLEEQRKKAVMDMFRMAYWYWTRPMAIYLTATLCVGKIQKEEAASALIGINREKSSEILRKINALFDDEEVLGFIQKYKADLFAENNCMTVEEKLENKTFNEVDFKIPIKNVYWVMKRLERAREQGFSKRYFYWEDWDSGNADLRRAFLDLTKYTEVNHRKQSKRYTVSRDEDKDAFYISAKGRLAKLPLYKLNKYIKQKKIVVDHNERRAVEDIPDGQYVRVGSYLQKHFPKVPQVIRERFQKAFEEIRPCHMVIDTDFKKAYDPMYQNHQDTDGDKASNYSCMSGYGDDAQQFYGKIHGCKIVRWETDNGNQVGRCLMYEYKGQRHFVRIYGLYEYHRTMINLLLNEMKPGDLFGRGESIKDMELETDWDENTRCMYLDGPYGVKVIHDYQDENSGYKYKVVRHGWDFDCNTTGHETMINQEESDEYYTCEHCGERVHEDDVWWCGDYTYCCEDCANEDGLYRCRWCDEWEHDDDGIWVDDGDSFYCCADHARRDGAECCDDCGEWKWKKDMLEIGGDYYCDEECAENAGWHICAECGEWCHEDDAINIGCDYYCDEECAKKDGWVKIGEEWKREEDVEEVKEQEPEEQKEVTNEG